MPLVYQLQEPFPTNDPIVTNMAWHYFYLAQIETSQEVMFMLRNVLYVLCYLERVEMVIT